MTDPVAAPPFAFHHGSGASMWQLPDGSVDMVLTSPPYYPSSIEEALRQPAAKQLNVEQVEPQITALALSLQPVFSEIARVLRGPGILAVQTKDLRYGPFLIGPMDTHRRLAEAAGFRLLTEIGWLSVPGNGHRRSMSTSPWRQGQFVTANIEKFLVFARSPMQPRARTGTVPIDYADPVWRLPGQGARTTHQHESPLSVLRRLIELYSEPGDLVLDPFCGHGTTSLAAYELGRRSVGYDIDAECVRASEARLEQAAAVRELRP